MVNSVGTHIPISLQNASALGSGDNSRFNPNILDQKIQIPEGADSEVFDTIAKGIQALRDADINLARQRLNEFQKRLSFDQTLLANGSEEQKEQLTRNAQSLGRELDSIGRQLGQIAGVDFSSSSTSIRQVEGSYSQSFNAAANYANGSRFSYAESLNVDFSFLEISQTTERFSIQRTENGIEIRSIKEQVSIVVAQLEVSQEQTLSISGLGAPDISNDLQQLVRDFQGTANAYNEYADELLAAFAETDKFAGVLQSALEALQQVQDILVESLSKLKTQKNPISLEA